MGSDREEQNPVPTISTTTGRLECCCTPLRAALFLLGFALLVHAAVQPPRSLEAFSLARRCLEENLTICGLWLHAQLLMGQGPGFHSMSVGFPGPRKMVRKYCHGTITSSPQPSFPLRRQGWRMQANADAAVTKDEHSRSSCRAPVDAESLQQLRDRLLPLKAKTPVPYRCCPWAAVQVNRWQFKILYMLRSVRWCFMGGGGMCAY